MSEEKIHLPLGENIQSLLSTPLPRTSSSGKIYIVVISLIEKGEFINTLF